MGESADEVKGFEMSAGEEALVRAHRASKELVRALQLEPFSEGTRVLALRYVPWRDEAAAVWEALQRNPDAVRGRLEELLRVSRDPGPPLTLADYQVAWVGPSRQGKSRVRWDAGVAEPSGAVSEEGRGEGGSGS